MRGRFVGPLIGAGGTCLHGLMVNPPLAVYVTPKSPRAVTKRDFAVYASKIQHRSKEVCCKVSLCENLQKQSCSYIIPPSNGP